LQIQGIFGVADLFGGDPN